MLLILSGALLLAGFVVLTFFGGRVSVERSPASLSAADQASVATALPRIREIQDFSLTNQSGTGLGRSDLVGRPWAINLIFTRCPGPCTQLSGVMRSIQSGLPRGSESRLLSLTSDPEHDTPQVLARYAEKVGANAAGWLFATGPRATIRKLATKDLMLVLEDKPEVERSSPEDLFLHSTLIVLVDRKGWVRNVVEGLEPGASGRVLRILGELEREE